MQRKVIVAVDLAVASVARLTMVATELLAANGSLTLVQVLRATALATATIVARFEDHAVLLDTKPTVKSTRTCRQLFSIACMHIYNLL